MQIALYWTSQNTITLGKWPIITDQAYLITPSSSEEMFNFVNLSFFLFVAFLITYLFPPNVIMAQSAGAAEYTDCISTEV